ncbi:Erythritol/L-threitol-binding protein [Paraburkholderia aspalathi]|nr:Erythritol/L-threitol-binding protein [Paraburkholderia aspalathi]CAE6832742.1 Erythritol/L-threitol-binding protein [Paraburkholderia aspalathi]
MRNCVKRTFPYCAICVGLLASMVHDAQADSFNWKKYQGTTLTLLANNNPVANALVKHKSEFENLTGMKLKVDRYQEQQMRQRLVTVMNSGSDEVDLFMSLPSREGMQFAKAGWYANLSSYVKNDVAPDYNFGDLSSGLVKDATFGGKLMGVPLNIEGPVLYYRKDLFEKCGVAVPQTLDQLGGVAQKLKACNPDTVPFVSRGLASALPFTFSVFLHNEGGQYMAAGKSQLCDAKGQTALKLYADLLKNYGPPGVVNYSFYQISSLYKEGRAAMAFESSNELGNLMAGGARLKDTGVTLLPPGPAGSHPTVLGWTMAISAQSKKKDAAWYFIQWASSPQTEAELAIDGIVPPRASVADQAEFRKWIDEQPVRREWITAINELGRTGESKIGYPIVANAESREYIGQAVTALILGQKNVQQACSAADTSLNGLIAGN